MLRIVREYGFLTVLVLAGAGSYFVLGKQTGSVLEDSLDAIGERFVAMAGNDETRASAIELFDQFRSRALSNEVSPEQLENVAANVLNMHTSGSHLSADEAMAVLEVSMVPHDSILAFLAAFDSTHVFANIAPSEPVDPAMFKESAERVMAAVEFAETVSSARTSGTSPSMMSRRVWFKSDKKMHVVVHDSLMQIVAEGERVMVARETRKLQHDEMLIWKEQSPAAERERLKSERSSSRVKIVRVPLDGDEQTLPSLRALANKEKLVKMLVSLQEKGYDLRIDADSLAEAIALDIELAMDAAEAADGSAEND